MQQCIHAATRVCSQSAPAACCNPAAAARTTSQETNKPVARGAASAARFLWRTPSTDHFVLPTHGII